MQPSWEAWLVKGILLGKYQNQWPIHRCRFAAFRGLMRNNYNLFAHHSAQAEKIICQLDVPFICLPNDECDPPVTNDGDDGDDDDENLKTTLALFAFCVFFYFIFAKRNSCGRVGKISKSASLTPMRHFGISMSMSCWVLMVIDVTFEPASEPVPKPHHLEPDLGWVYQIGSLLAAHSRPTHPPSSQKP